MNESKKRVWKIVAACVAAVLVAAMLAGIFTFAFLQPFRPLGEIAGADLKGDRAAGYTLETRNYFTVRLRNWVERLLGWDGNSYGHISMQSSADYLLRAFAEAGIPTDKVRGIADYLEAQDPSETLERLILAFCHPAVDEDGNEIDGSYVFDVNSDPTSALLALVGANTAYEFFATTLLTPEEGGAVLYYAIYNGLSDEDKATLGLIGRDRFVNLTSGFTRIATNLDSFIAGVSAQEARIMYELIYTVGADFQVFVDVLGAETIERLFGVRASAFPFDPEGNVEVEEEQLEHLINLLDGAQGLTAFSVITLSAFLNHLSPDIFTYYQRYTATGERRDLIYAVLLTARALSAAIEAAGNTEGNIDLWQAIAALQTVTDEAIALGAAEDNAPYSALELGLAFYAFLTVGESVQTREDLDTGSVYRNLSNLFETFEAISSPSDVREFAGLNVLLNLNGFRLLTLLLSVDVI